MKSKSLGIVLASDANYLPYVWPLIRDLKSMLSYCPPITLMFDGEVENTQDLQNLCSRLNIELRVIDISEELNDPYLNTIRYLTRATFARLFAVKYLKPDFDRILYLDIDILIVRDFSFIFYLEMTQTIAAVPENFDSMAKAFGTHDFSYFNAGVLLINTQRWEDEKISEQCIQAIRDKGPFNCQDQDALNLVFENRWQVLPPTSNVMVSTYDHSLDLPQLNQPAIVHFIGEHKPWKNVKWTRWHKIWIERNLDLMFSYSYTTNGDKNQHGSSRRNFRLKLRFRHSLLKGVSFCLNSSIIKVIFRKMNLKNVKILRKFLGLNT